MRIQTNWAELQLWSAVVSICPLSQPSHSSKQSAERTPPLYHFHDWSVKGCLWATLGKEDDEGWAFKGTTGQGRSVRSSL